jgi:hypothetical protein
MHLARTLTVSLTIVLWATLATATGHEVIEAEAQTLEERQRTLEDEVTPILDVAQAYQLERVEMLKHTQLIIVKREKAQQIEGTEIRRAKALLGDAVAAHSGRCPRESYDEGLVAWCNGEADRLNSKVEKLNVRIVEHAQAQDTLDVMIKNQTEQTVIVTKARKKIEHQMWEVDAEIARIEGQLKAIEHLNIPCRSAIVGYDIGLVSLERLKSTCSAIFDGNPSNVPVVDVRGIGN